MRETAAKSSLLPKYIITKDLSLEIEGDVRCSRRAQGATTESETDFFVLAGYLYDFYADGQRARMS